ncbi:MAG TPA: hypothetical protein VMJ12_14395 [Candidatus Acidoferrales bacterium]|nr:hypothetical protein [Candidatus Acidoferrales bacterium]
MLASVAIMDNQVPRVGQPRHQVGEDNDVMPVVKERIQQQQQRAGQAEPPEKNGDDHLLVLLRGVPLHKKTREENGIAQPANRRPENDPIHAEYFSVARQPIHKAWSLKQQSEVQSSKFKLQTPSMAATRTDF